MNGGVWQINGNEEQKYDLFSVWKKCNLLGKCLYPIAKDSFQIK